MIELIGITITAAVIGIAGIRIVTPTHEMLHERFGKYIGTRKQGFNWVIPIIDQTRYVDITEQMVDIPEQFVITKDDLNAKVDGVVYFKVMNCPKAVYKAQNYKRQITSLARTTLRDIFGKMTLTDANSKRAYINDLLEKELDKQTDAWGIDIVRVELQEIQPPRQVVEAMNQVVVAEREKTAAVNFANAEETKADGIKRASIKQAEGRKKAQVLDAEGKAEAIKLVNQSAEKYFKGNAQVLEKLKTTKTALQNGTKYVIDPKSNITNVMTEMSGVTPINKK